MSAASAVASATSLTARRRARRRAGPEDRDGGRAGS